jgi:hypothetical protein
LIIGGYEAVPILRYRVLAGIEVVPVLLETVRESLPPCGESAAANING